MARITNSYHYPDRCVVGTVGQPGQRTFFLQVRDGNRISSVQCEKEQIEVLLEYLDRVLGELGNLLAPELVPPPLDRPDDLDPLDMPLEVDFRVETISLAWNPAEQCVVLELFSPGGSDEEDGEDEADESVDIWLTPAQSREFVARCHSVLTAGRPACPFCEQPMNPDGHVCPRANGYRPPLF